MIELRDTVTVEVAPAVLWHWLESMPDHYLEWHPDHLEARWVRGDALVPGAVMEVREVLHGKPHRLRMRVTEARQGRFVRYRVLPGVSGSFSVEPADQGARLTAVIAIGTSTPVIGRLVDRLLRRVLSSRIEAIARHQGEEVANLKLLLEKGADTSTQ